MFDFLKKFKLLNLGEKPYKCEQCSSVFAQKSDLNEHIRIHKCLTSLIIL